MLQHSNASAPKAIGQFLYSVVLVFQIVSGPDSGLGLPGPMSIERGEITELVSV